MVERIGSYLGTSLPLFHGYTPPRDAADICLALCLANDVPNSNLDTSYPDIWFHFYISHNQGSFAINSLLVMLWTLKSTWLSSKALSKWFIPQPKNSMSPSTSRPQPVQCPWRNCLHSFWRSLWCLIYIDTVHFQLSLLINLIRSLLASSDNLDPGHQSQCAENI